jgi:predicted dehydrogenase
MKENKKVMGVGIVGAGLIGKKRAEAIKAMHYGKLIAVADPDHVRAKALAETFKVEALTDWKKLLERKDIDVVIVAVPNAFATPIVLAALKHGKHVLCEKPFGINVKESKRMIVAAKKAKKLVKVGFNHRFHAGVLKAHEIFEKGGIGKRVLFIRSRYGHGGRKGMEKEWRFDKKVSGGGELLDQGVHIIDLARWFGGEFSSASGLARTKFWNTGLDDNAFAFLENARTTVSLHASATQWKNLFSFEIYGDEGYLNIEGKGGSYGRETLEWGKKNVGAAPEVHLFEFNEKDESWHREWKNFIRAIKGKEKLIGSTNDGLKANQIVKAIYASSKKGRSIRLT